MFLLAILGFWLAVRFIDWGLRKWYSAPYRAFRATHGVDVGLISLTYQTRSLNPLFFRSGKAVAWLWKSWFTVGIIVGVLAMIIAPILLSWNFYAFLKLLFSKFSDETADVYTVEGGGSETEQVAPLVAIVPGVTVPLWHFLYMFIAILLNGMLHEAGHAWAAVAAGVRINSSGIFVMGIYPGAFVALHTPQLRLVYPIEQLRIFCAGVWHNVVIGLLSLALLHSYPVLLSPFYIQDHGGVVLNVRSGSSVSHSIAPGDVISRIDHCDVRSGADWLHCLQNLQQSYDLHPEGLCIPKSIFYGRSTTQRVWKKNDVLECCDVTDSASERTLTRLCFGKQEALKTPFQPTNFDQKDYSCLAARTVVDSSTKRCTRTSDCDEDSVCGLATVEDSVTRLLPVYADNKAAILYFGSILELYNSVEVSDYIPKSNLFSMYLPSMIDLLLQYLISISFSFAVLNMVPGFNLDGQFAMEALVNFLFPMMAGDTRELITILTMAVASTLLAVNLLGELIKMTVL